MKIIPEWLRKKTANEPDSDFEARGKMMTICARSDGRKIKTCTRGLQGCLCALEIIEIAGRIAYPERGSGDEYKTLFEFVDEIQKDNPLSAFTD